MNLFPHEPDQIQNHPNWGLLECLRVEILDVIATCRNGDWKWPSGKKDVLPQWIEYRGSNEDGEHTVNIGFRNASRYERNRKIGYVWIDNR